MARLSDADQGELPVPRFHPRGPDHPGSRAAAGPGSAGGHAGHPGVAFFLLQGADDRARPVSGTRSLYSTHETEEYAPLDAWRGPDYPPWSRLLRLTEPGTGCSNASVLRCRRRIPCASVSLSRSSTDTTLCHLWSHAT